MLTYHDFTSALSFHPVFYSYCIFLSILIFSVQFFSKNLSAVEKFTFSTAFCICITGLLVSASKNVLVVTSVFALFVVIFRIIKFKVGFKEWSAISLILVLVVVFVTTVPSVKSRVEELTELSGMENYSKWKRGELIVEDDISNFNGTSLRWLFWNVSINKLLKENQWFLGYSPGDRRAVINEEYSKIGLNPWYQDYNLHNQFIQIFVELGVVGLVIYLLLHLQLIMLAVKQNNYILLFLTLGLIIFQLTESVIERNKGIVFFTYTLCLLSSLTSTKLNENRNIRNQRST